MADPFTLLAQQANQTANLFNAINDNTQKVFANRFAVQQAKTNLALNVAQQTETYRMNDAKLKELDQVMRMRDQEQAWKVKDQEFQDKVRPLQFKTQELMYENQFLQRTEQQLKPFMSDLNPILADLTTSNPELATEAQTRYQTMIYDITQKALKDPTIDIQKELQIKKEEVKKWAASQKLTNKSLIGSAIEFGKDALGVKESPSWLKNIEDSVNPQASPEVVARAAGIYKQFGGSDVEFLKRHDPQYAKSIESDYELMITTGRVTPERFALLDDEQKKNVLNKVKRDEQEQNLLATIKTYQTQLDDAMSADKGTGIYASRIASMQERIKGLNDKYAKEFLGIDFDAKPTQSQSPEDIARKNKILEEASSGAPPTVNSAGQAVSSALTNDFNNVAQIIKKISPATDGEINEVAKKYIENPDSVKQDDIAKLIANSSDGSIIGIANTDWFQKHIEDNGLDISGRGDAKGYTKIGEAMKILTSDSRPFFDDIFSSSEKRIFTTDRDRLYSDKEKQDATNVLKSNMPKILFDYLNQNR